MEHPYHRERKEVPQLRIGVISMLFKRKNPLSLIQTISAIFIIITAMVIGLSTYTSKSFDKIGSQFNQLSHQVLPLVTTNAELTQSLLEQVKQLGFSTQASSEARLETIQARVNQLSNNIEQHTKNLLLITEQFDQVISSKELSALKLQLTELESLTQQTLDKQNQIVVLEASIASSMGGFQYGIRSIGPEMNRIASFLAEQDPEVLDAANRYVSSAGALERHFLNLLALDDAKKANQEYRQIRNSISGANLAYGDFSDLRPEVKEFSSLTAAYDMVKEGFKDEGIVSKVMEKIERSQEQKQVLTEVALAAEKTIQTLDGLSNKANALLKQSETVVSDTISLSNNTLAAASAALVVAIAVFWLSLRNWTNCGLKNISHHLKAMVDHDFTQNVEEKGPKELAELGMQLNQVIESTRTSIELVTRNSEALYQTAEVSWSAAEKSQKSLTEQNQSLEGMVVAMNQLESSIKEIASISHDSHMDTKAASDYSERGVDAIQSNYHALQSLEHTLDQNETSLKELDHRVKQIREMVDLISGIAENTNLLALNAAIEAARAGEQGRGFAVVADEVRKLASDTSDQTTSIRERMNQLVAAAEKSRESMVHTRSEMVNALKSGGEVKHAFEDIQQAVSHIQQRVEQITVATEEQDRATAGVSQSINQVSEQGKLTSMQLESLVETSEEVSRVAEHQQAMLHKYAV